MKCDPGASVVLDPEDGSPCAFRLQDPDVVHISQLRGCSLCEQCPMEMCHARPAQLHMVVLFRVACSLLGDYQGSRGWGDPPPGAVWQKHLLSSWLFPKLSIWPLPLGLRPFFFPILEKGTVKGR